MARGLMNYRVTCLTPTLVGDGGKLSPIDYMVWRDQVNVLDQTRIFRLLAKGSRLEGYLTQIRKADKLDFSSWGGFAQNFAGRRIPFDHAAYTAVWEKARSENLFIPTFASGPAGAYLPGSALKGALRTGLLNARWSDAALKELDNRFKGDRPPRNPGEVVENASLGAAGVSRLKPVAVSDSRAVPASAFRVYLVRVSTLVAKGGRYELGWKQSPRGTVETRRIEESTPIFAEMAAPGAVFEGEWQQRPFFSQPDVLRALHWREPVDYARLAEAANSYSARILSLHRQYADWTGLVPLRASLEMLQQRLDAVRGAGQGCIFPLGWGTGLLGKSGTVDTGSEDYRRTVGQLPFFARALASGMPFPKTRRIVFVGNQPAALPGWVLLEVG
ncbi:MAG: type III-A CRISPR-associated RAMP protein Csm5 [Bryobacteraceae bacterium]|nr:type III-A CRISPR-associated RAMP protein Csm5 [Bryobacteraceae bacterium]